MFIKSKRNKQIWRSYKYQHYNGFVEIIELYWTKQSNLTRFYLQTFPWLITVGHKWVCLTGVNAVWLELSDVDSNIPVDESPASDISVDSVTSDVSESTIREHTIRAMQLQKWRHELHIIIGLAIPNFDYQCKCKRQIHNMCREWNVQFSKSNNMHVF